MLTLQVSYGQSTKRVSGATTLSVDPSMGAPNSMSSNGLGSLIGTLPGQDQLKVVNATKGNAGPPEAAHLDYAHCDQPWYGGRVLQRAVNLHQGLLFFASSGNRRVLVP